MNVRGLMTIARRTLPAMLAMTAVVSAGGVAHVSAAGTPGSGAPLDTTLAGANEVPPANDPQAGGSALLRLNPGQGTVCFEISWRDVPGTVTHAHIHKASAGVAGSIVVPLFNGSFPSTGSDSGCVSAGRSLITAIINDPSGYYVNIHSTVYPAGAGRGQLDFPGKG